MATAPSSSSAVPKQWKLQKKETLVSFEQWRSNSLFHLGLNKNYAPFLHKDVSWRRAPSNTPFRGLMDDITQATATDPAVVTLSAQDKLQHLSTLLAWIANYAPVVSRNTIENDATSIANVLPMPPLSY